MTMNIIVVWTVQCRLGTYANQTCRSVKGRLSLLANVCTLIVQLAAWSAGENQIK